MVKNFILIVLFSLILSIIGCTSNKIPEKATEENLQKFIEEDIKNPIGESIEEPIMDPPEDIINKPIEEIIEESDKKSNEENYEFPTQISFPRIIVRKSARKLELWDGDNLLKSYPIGLGFDPIGHKKVEGDGRTPEGSYFVCTRNDESKFYKSLGVSYPNKKDAQTALEEETINDLTYKTIVDSFDKKVKPPWDTPMGGQIMIHGHGSHKDWTAGCVAVEDDIMDILWNFCPIGTPITILP